MIFQGVKQNSLAVSDCHTQYKFLNLKETQRVHLFKNKGGVEAGMPKIPAQTKKNLKATQLLKTK